MNALVLNLPIWGIIGLVIGSIVAFFASEDARRPVVAGIIAFSIVLSVFLAIGFGLTSLGYMRTGEGTHIGYVTAVGTEGLIFKTTTIHFKTDNAQSQEDAYCAADPGVIDGLRRTSELKQRVELHYANYFVFGPGCEYTSDTTIDSFRVLA